MGPPGSLPGEEESSINTRDDPTNLETRRVDVPLVVEVDVHPPPIPPPFQCDICGQTFGKRAGLNGHMKKKHSKIEQLDSAQELKNYDMIKILKEIDEMGECLDNNMKRMAD